MEGWIAVAGDALLGRTLEDIVQMALRALHTGMCAGQLEGSLGVVEAGMLPVVRRVAAAAIGTELALVGVIFRMAGGAILRCTLEDVIHMAFIASHIRMLAGQLKSCFGVVESCLLPIIRRMASAAICAKLALVGIILCMAGSAVLFGGLEIRQPAYSGVTGGAGNSTVLAGQLERILAVVEAAPETVYAIVTGPAVCSIILGMLLNIGRIDLGMAYLAYGWIEICETGVVTVFAGEIGAISHPLVGCK